MTTRTHTDKYTHLQAHKHACTHLQTYTITDTRLHIQTHTPTHTHRHVRMSGYQTHPCKRARLQTLHLPVRQKILSCYPDLRPLVGCLTHGSIPLSPCASLHNKRLWICRNLLSNTIAGPCLIQHPSFGFCSTQIRACLPTAHHIFLREGSNARQLAILICPDRDSSSPVFQSQPRWPCQVNNGQ